MTIRAGIIGATGYTGVELMRLLQQHREVALTYLVTDSYKDRPIADVYPHLKKSIALAGKGLDVAAIIEHCDLIFLALPPGKAGQLVKTLLEAGKKVIDLSADFRLRNPKDHSHWYQEQAPAADIRLSAVYGLAEAGYRDAISQASLIANPGCYPSASILAAMPALKAGIIEPNDCIFDAKSGVSGAGRGLKLQSHYCEVNENITPYQLGGMHRHTPEIEQELSLIAKQALTIQFTPHLVPMTRGMLVTAYFKLKQPLVQQAVVDLYQEAYQSDSFIRVSASGEIPDVRQVRGTNYCDMGIIVDERTGRLMVVSVIDNLMKGASGQAIQNMNLLYQFPETLGLDHISIYP